LGAHRRRGAGHIVSPRAQLVLVVIVDAMFRLIDIMKQMQTKLAAMSLVTE